MGMLPYISVLSSAHPFAPVSFYLGVPSVLNLVWEAQIHAISYMVQILVRKSCFWTEVLNRGFWNTNSGLEDSCQIENPASRTQISASKTQNLTFHSLASYLKFIIWDPDHGLLDPNPDPNSDPFDLYYSNTSLQDPDFNPLDRARPRSLPETHIHAFDACLRNRRIRRFSVLYGASTLLGPRACSPIPSTWSKNYSGRVWVPRSAFRLLFSLFSQQKKSFFVICFGAFLGIFFYLLMGSWHINNIAVSSGFGGKHNTKQFATDSQCR